MKRLVLFLCMVMLPLTAPLTAKAEIEIDLTRGVREPMPIAITTFYASAPGNQN